ncbi:RES family NAD+ phosphorylase [Nocardioides sp. BGMRC 2183]|nr:RES family NAD+ phosphorylase [Nocardioides sp. BGMRC 2183]
MADLPALPAAVMTAGRPLFRCYDGTWGYDEPNPGYGDARFSPFDSPSGDRVPTLYLGDTPLAALLETVFHDVHHSSARLVFDTSLRDNLLAHVRLPADLRLADLRDSVLDDLGLERGQLVSSPAEHYPCTRRLSRHIHEVGTGLEMVDGIVWHSRQAELHGGSPAEVMVVFANRYDPGRGGWTRVGPGSQNLYEGPGRLLVEQTAVDINATIVTS